MKGHRVTQLSFKSLFSKKPVKLAMNLLVKNEEDIILDNIKAHSQLGVDCFVIIDNGSTDGTWEKLESVRNNYEIKLISRPVLDYQQTAWKTEMAVISRDELGADWSIANDADEFWIPDSGSLKSVLSRTRSIVYCPRFNVLYEREAFDNEAPFYTQTLRTNHPILYSKEAKATEENLSIMLSKIQGKVLINTNGLMRVRGGNHRGRHLWGWLNRKETNAIHVYHYPIRTLEHFVSHIENRKDLLAKGCDRFGDHYKRWVSYYDENKLEAELDRLVLSKTDAGILLKYGIIVSDEKAKQVLQPLLG